LGTGTVAMRRSSPKASGPLRFASAARMGWSRGGGTQITAPSPSKLKGISPSALIAAVIAAALRN
jgi:hypothetical protein